jgi:hypothetical protein
LVNDFIVKIIPKRQVVVVKIGRFGQVSIWLWTVTIATASYRWVWHLKLACRTRQPLRVKIGLPSSLIELMFANCLDLRTPCQSLPYSIEALWIAQVLDLPPNPVPAAMRVRFGESRCAAEAEKLLEA